MRSFTYITVIAVIALLCASAFAANHAILASSTCTVSCGSNWTTAYSGFGSSAGQINPASMVRGDLYCVGPGNYGVGVGITFSTADSSTTLISIMAPLSTNTCATIPGFSSGSDVGQAVFGPLNFTTDYWTFNGVYRGSTGQFWIDWKTGYGFKVENNVSSPSTCTFSTPCAPVQADGAIINGVINTSPVSGITIEYVEVQGSGDISGSEQDGGIYTSWALGCASAPCSNTQQSNNITTNFNYVHDVGAASMILCDSCNQESIQYNWLENLEVSPNHHSEPISQRCWGAPATGNDSNITIAYNVVVNSNATSSIASPCTTDIHPSNWSIYGNAFILNTAEMNQNYICHVTSPSGNQTECGNNPGWLSLWNFATWTGYLNVFNNTIIAMDNYSGFGVGTQGGCGHDWGGANPTSMGTVAFYNNIYYGCASSINQPSCPATSSCTSYVDAYNSYFLMTGTITDSGTGKQTAAINPFVNIAQTIGANNFNLATDTSAWFNTSSLLAANSTDLLGNTRTSSRGALQFESGAAATSTAQGVTLHGATIH